MPVRRASNYMWVLTLTHNDSEAQRALRSGSSLKVGRSHEYRTDPNALYIGDLKVPKTYITVKIGQVAASKSEKSPCSIVFESRCTTRINGLVYKLASKDSQTFEKVFHENELVLYVNANQSDKIQIRLKWVPVTLLVFSKKVQYNDSVQESPLVQRISAMVEAGIDFRTTSDPTVALHYLAPSAYFDYNLQIALLRAIPVVSEDWCNYITTNFDDIQSWLLGIRLDLYLQTEGMISIPNKYRSTLLEGKTVALNTENTPPKVVTRFKTWLQCLGTNEVIVLNEQLGAVKSKLETLEEIFIFIASGKREIKGANVNSQEDLWQAVTSIDTSHLKSTKTKDLLRSEKRPLPEESPTKKQRRVRRKIERVSDTDFFLFTPLTSSLPPESTPIPESFNIGSPEISTGQREATLSPAKDSQQQSEGLDLDNLEKSKNFSPNPDGNETKRFEAIAKSTETTSPTESSPEGSANTIRGDVKDGKILPQKSFAEAIMSTKEQASSGMAGRVKDEDPQAQEEVISCNVELIHLNPRRRIQNQAEPNSRYKGRKNFKTFKKHGKTPNFVTRTYISLRNDNNEVIFNSQRSDPLAHHFKKRDKDFSTEMATVRGFQPEASQLFVDEDVSDDEAVQFLQKSRFNARLAQGSTGRQDNIFAEELDDEEVAFTFSKR